MQWCKWPRAEHRSRLNGPASESKSETDMTGQSEFDQFQVWLMEMDDAIRRFIEPAPPGVPAQLDFSDASLNAVESWVLSKYAKPQDIRSRSEAQFHDGAARYIGEVFRMRTFSKWTLDLSDPKALNYGVPALTGGKLAIGLCPLTLVTACIDRRKGDYLWTILKNVSG
jgi:hypothetical protein